MTPYEIMLSESQERMLLVADKGREEEVFRGVPEMGTDAVTIGVVTGDGMLRVQASWQCGRRDSQPRTGGRGPLYDRPHTRRSARRRWTRPSSGPGDLRADLRTLLGSGDICSKRWIWEQYDYMVRTNTLAGPGGDAAVIRIKETGTASPCHSTATGATASSSPREGTKLAVAECCRNLSAVGAQPVAATNNLNFGNPERPEIMAQLVEAIEGMARGLLNSSILRSPAAT